MLAKRVLPELPARPHIERWKKTRATKGKLGDLIKSRMNPSKITFETWGPYGDFVSD
jgi:hypothetical protein